MLPMEAATQVVVAEARAESRAGQGCQAAGRIMVARVRGVVQKVAVVVPCIGLAVYAGEGHQIMPRRAQRPAVESYDRAPVGRLDSSPF